MYAIKEIHNNIIFKDTLFEIMVVWHSNALNIIRKAKMKYWADPRFEISVKHYQRFVNEPLKFVLALFEDQKVDNN